MAEFNVKTNFKLVTTIGEGDNKHERVNAFHYTNTNLKVEARVLVAMFMAMKGSQLSVSHNVSSNTRVVVEVVIDEKKKKDNNKAEASSSSENTTTTTGVQILEHAHIALQFASVIRTIVKSTLSSNVTPPMLNPPTQSLGLREVVLIGNTMPPLIQRFLDDRQAVLNEWTAAMMVLHPNLFVETGEGSSHLPSEDTHIFEAVMQAAAKSLVEIKREVDNYDRLVGDGDCGTTLAKGALEVIKDLLAHKYPLVDISETFKSLATTMERSIGDTAIGVIYQVGCLAVCAHLKGLQTISLNEWSFALSAAINAISQCGGASEGQRTLLDALYPALGSLQESIASTKDNSEAFVASAEASLEGATKTKAMIAQAGKSFKASLALQEVVPDPGAFATATWYKAAAEEYRKLINGA